MSPRDRSASGDRADRPESRFFGQTARRDLGTVGDLDEDPDEVVVDGEPVDAPEEEPARHDLGQQPGVEDEREDEASEAGGGSLEHDDEMDAFFPSVARAAAAGGDVAAMLDEDLLVNALAERDEYLDALRRLQADFENFRKRTDRQLAEVRARASEALLERLLPVADALDLALAHLSASAAAGSEDSSGDGAGSAGQASGGGEHASSEALKALVQVAGLLRDTLAKEGLERIDEVGVPFDPTVHDAVAHAPAGEGDDGDDANPGGVVVDEVMRAGYLLKGRVLRPAMVKVRG